MDAIFGIPELEKIAKPVFSGKKEEELIEMMNRLDHEVLPELRRNARHEADSIRAAKHIILSV